MKTFQNLVIALFVLITVSLTVLMACLLIHSNRLTALEEAMQDNSSAEQSDGLERNLVRFRVTAYCPCEICCGAWADDVTASGHKIKPVDKFVAAPKEYPFGTTMNIPNYGRAKVLDRGGAIKGNRIDVYFGTHQEALEWGVQYLNVEINRAGLGD